MVVKLKAGSSIILKNGFKINASVDCKVRLKNK